MNILIICLAQVLLSSILLFVYFKSRVSKVEEKLDIMFQLVQSHSSNQQQDNIKFYENNTQNNQINETVDDTLYNKPDVNLISISDSEEEDSNEDSDEDSNEDSDEESDEDGDEENINELIIGKDIKKISLNLEDENNEDIPIILEKKDNIETLNQENFDILSEENLEILSQENLNAEILEEVSVDLTLEEETDYDKLKVVELKQLCQEKELQNYKKLRRSELIELLQKN
tara:strand:+ start:7341 stop:8030 length:690 start_codon:yes stop_codon:yes gene_type:complete